jgi:large subunit ribosomal protein L9
MQVLLIEDVDNLGLAGDAVNVRPGYARNYLIPQRLAMLATAGAMKQAESIRKAGEARRAREKADAEAIVGQIQDVLLVFERRAGDRGQLYGSVTVSDIAEALSDKAGLEIDRRKIRLPEPLRTLGEWDVEVRLMVEVSTSIHVAVIQEGETYVPGQVSVEAEADEAEAISAAAEAKVEVVVQTEEIEEVVPVEEVEILEDTVEVES